MLQSNTLTRVWMEDYKVPIAYGARSGSWEHVGYDDVQSVEEKVTHLNTTTWEITRYYVMQHVSI